MAELVLSEAQKDALKEIGNICAGNAATSLSQLIGRRIVMDVPQIFFVRIEDVPQVVGGPEKLVACVILNVLGDAPGTILLIFPQKDALSLMGMLTNKERVNGVLTEIDQSAIKEVGSILSAAYLSTFSNFTGLGLIPSVPGMVIDMAGALMDYILIELAQVSDYALVIESDFSEATKRVRGHFFLLPNAGSLQAILKTIGIRINE